MAIDLETAKGWHRKGRLDKAERAYLKLLRRKPPDPGAMAYLGVLRHQQGRSEEARQLLRRALKLRPADVDARLNLGRVLLETGDPDGARSRFESVLAGHPGNPIAASSLCVILRVQGELQAAVEMGRRAVALAPDDFGCWLNLAHALERQHDYSGAGRAYLRAIEFDPASQPAHRGMGHVLYRMELQEEIPAADRQALIDGYRRVLEGAGDDPQARFMLAAISGEATPERVPDQVVAGLFDDFAAQFDTNLSRLQYRVPALVEACLEQLPDLPESELRVLDAGCGTGLCAGFLRGRARWLEGVDLSRRMLDRAKATGHYDRLHEAELGAWLRSQREAFDLVVFADTLCYFGDLRATLKATSAVTSDGGYLVFTVERADRDAGEAYYLQSSGRYRHTEAHVEARLVEAGFTPVELEPVELRLEAGQPVPGLLVSARR